MSENKEVVMKEITSKTIDYIENHLNEKFNLDEIAKAVGYSKYHLNRMFSEITGKTIHKYIQERRLSDSAVKLISSNHPIIEIAQEAGYSSQQSYTLAFRRFYQCTPNVYRMQYTVSLQNISHSISSSMNSWNNIVCLMSKGVMAA